MTGWYFPKLFRALKLVIYPRQITAAICSFAETYEPVTFCYMTYNASFFLNGLNLQKNLIFLGHAVYSIYTFLTVQVHRGQM